MKASIELSPDELAELVAAVMEYNGASNGVLLSLYRGDELVGYDRVVISYPVAGLLKVPNAYARKLLELREQLASRSGVQPAQQNEQGTDGS